jgi:hypothetical protein
MCSSRPAGIEGVLGESGGSQPRSLIESGLKKEIIAVGENPFFLTGPPADCRVLYLR